MVALFTPFILQAQSSKTFSVTEFDAIKSAGSTKVILTQGSEFSVEAEGEQERLDKLDIHVQNGTLHIGQKKQKGNWSNNNWKNYKGSLKVYVTFQNIEELTLSGSGEIECDNKMTFDDLEVNLSGSGNIKLKGTVNNLDVSVTGSGDIEAFGLEAETVEARVTGSGDIEVAVERKLEARVTGSGDIEYDAIGENLNINSKVTGSGDVDER